MNRRHALGLIAAGLAIPHRALAAPAEPPPQTGGHKAFALVGGEVHTADGRVIREGLVEVRGGRIVRVAGQDAAPGLSADVDRIDVSSKVVTPGLIGAQTSLGLTEIGMEASTRDTSRNTPDPIHAAYDVSVAINADSSVLAVQAVEGITSAAVAPSGGLITGQTAWIDLRPGDHRNVLVKPRIALTMGMGQSFAGSRAATVAKLQEVFDDAETYRRRKGAFERRQSRDLAAHRLDLEALGPALDGRIPIFVGAQRVSEILAALDFAQLRKLRIVLVGASQAWKVADAIAAAKVPVVMRPSANLPGGFDRLGSRLDHAALLEAAGVEVCIARPGEAHNVRNIRQEAGIAIAYGLNREAALAAVTARIARAYGMDRDYGTLGPGKLANIVVWDGDPFELSTWPAGVWIRGERIDLRSRQTDLRDRYLDLSKFEP